MDTFNLSVITVFTAKLVEMFVIKILNLVYRNLSALFIRIIFSNVIRTKIFLLALRRDSSCKHSVNTCIL